MSRRAVAALLAIVALVAVARIASTWQVFSQTVDEPIHIAAGYEWLHAGRYTLDREHPPLARIFFGLDAWTDGAEAAIEGDRAAIGNELLERGDRYRRNLAGARAGNLPFFLLGMAVVFLWTRRLAGDVAGVIAAALFGALPPVLAHAGLATTDMAAASTTALALYALSLWLEKADWKRTLLFGSALGLGLVGKFSFVVFFGAGALVLLLRERRALARRATTTATTSGAAAFSEPGYEWMRPDLLDRYYDYAGEVERRNGIIGIDIVDWAKAAGYPSPLAGRKGNTLAGAPPVPPPTLPQRVAEPFRASFQWIATHVPLSAPSFLAGIEYVGRHSAIGHAAYLFGETRSEGWWYYFPVILFFKTPLPFLLLAMIGMIRRPTLALIPVAMLAVAMTAGINIGVRHLLPMFPFLAVLAALAVVWLWQRSRLATGILLAWFFIGTAIAHPDYLAWFNEAAGRHPERIAADSNLDWGQDLLRLGDFARRHPVDYVWYWGSRDWKREVPRAKDLPASCVAGWIAVSEMTWIEKRDDELRWLRTLEPQRRVGKSIRIYFVPRCPPV